VAEINPSLLDIIKPLLLEKGWVAMKDREDIYEKDGTSVLITEKVWRVVNAARLDGTASTLGIALIDNPNLARMVKKYGGTWDEESLNPADPLFFSKLEEWIK
jgi:hypothetical protein